MTEELKEKLRQAKTAEEAKQIVDSCKGELSDEDLSSIAGGTGEEYEDTGLSHKKTWCPLKDDDCNGIFNLFDL